MAVLFRNSGSETNGYFVFPASGGGNVTVLFQHIPEDLRDGRKANYEVKEIAKRTEPLLIYQTTMFREISFSLRFGARSVQEAYEMYAFANLLRRSVFPTTAGIPNSIKLNLGPFFVYYDVQDTGNGFTLVNSPDYSESTNGMNCVITDYSITPTSERLNPSLSDVPKDLQGATPSNWWVKVPAAINISLGLYVFLGQVWGKGCMSSSLGMGNPNTKGSKDTQGASIGSQSVQGADPAGNSPHPETTQSGDGSKPLPKPNGSIASQTDNTDENGVYSQTTTYADANGNVTGKRVISYPKDGGHTVVTQDFSAGKQSVTTWKKGGDRGSTFTSPLSSATKKPSSSSPSGTGKSSWS